MQVRKPVLLPLIFSLFVLVATACNGTTNSSAPTSSAPLQVTTLPTDAPVQATTAPDPKQQGAPPISLPLKHVDEAGDINSSLVAAKKMAPPGSDAFVKGLFERPFNANTMDTYFPYIDIVDIQGYIDDTWGYETITLSGVDANGHLPAKYGVELDLNRDGRGDWLIIVSNPSSTTWSTQGVQAWKDTNGDVGGIIPFAADKAVSNGDGFETLVFDQGKGSDNPDGAWSRISPDDNKTVQVAFKLSMLGSPKSYAMGAWAGSDLNPAMFDYNDHMTHLQAGDPDPSIQLYPIKGLSEIDNTCRLAIGFSPTGIEPGLCSTFIKQHHESGGPNPVPPPPPPGNPNGGRGTAGG
jgi:hypothetical protein